MAMRSAFDLLRRLKRALVLALGLGLMAGAVAWTQLPPEPRTTLEGVFEDIVFAPDGTTFVTVEQVGSPDGNGVVPWWKRAYRILLWDAASTERKAVLTEKIEYYTPSPIVYSPDSRRIAVFVSERAVGQRGSRCTLRVWDSQTGHEEQAITHADWMELSEVDAVFFSRQGELRGFRPTDKGYDVWDIGGRRRVCAGCLPSWCTSWPPEDPLSLHSRQNTSKMATAIEGRWDVVLRTYCSGFSIAGLGGEPIVVSGDGKTLVRVGTGETEVWDLVEGSIRHRLAIPGVREVWSRLALALSPEADFVVVAAYLSEETETAWQQLRGWLGVGGRKATAVGTAATASAPDLWLLETSTGHPTAHFPLARKVSFSAGGDSLGVVYQDRVELWDFPLHKPWGKIVAAALVPCFAVLALAVILRLLRRSKGIRGVSGAEAV